MNFSPPAGKMKYWQFFGVIATISCIIGLGLWIVVACVVSIASENGNDAQLLYREMCYICSSLFPSDMCNPSWRRIRDGLIIAGCLFSVLVLVSTIVLAILLCLITQCLEKEVVRNYFLIYFFASVHFVVILVSIRFLFAYCELTIPVSMFDYWTPTLKRGL